MGNAVIALGFRVFLGISAIDAVDIGGLQHRLGVEFGGAQDSGGIGRKERIAGAGGQQHDAAFGQVFHRALAVVGLAHGGHGERRQRARLAPRTLDGGFEHQAIHHRRQHAHGVADRARHATVGDFDAAEDIAAADHHAELDAEPGSRHQIGGKAFDHFLIDAEALLTGERFARELDDDAAVKRFSHSILPRGRRRRSSSARPRPPPRRRNPFPASRSPRRARNARSRRP